MSWITCSTWGVPQTCVCRIEVLGELMVVLAKSRYFSTESTAYICFLAGAQTSKPKVARSLGSSHSGSFGGGIVRLVSVFP